MRVMFCTVMLAAFAAQAQTGNQPINLDKPGALEALEKSNPGDYEAVIKEVRLAEKQICKLDTARHRADLKPGREPCHAYIISTSYPGKVRLAVPVHEKRYLITVALDTSLDRTTPAR